MLYRLIGLKSPTIFGLWHFGIKVIKVLLSSLSMKLDFKNPKVDCVIVGPVVLQHFWGTNVGIPSGLDAFQAPN